MGRPHPPQMLQCLARAGRCRPQVLQAAAPFVTPSYGVARCAGRVAGVTIPGSASPVAMKAASTAATTPEPVYLQRRPDTRQMNPCTLITTPPAPGPAAVAASAAHGDTGSRPFQYVSLQVRVRGHRLTNRPQSMCLRTQRGDRLDPAEGHGASLPSNSIKGLPASDLLDLCRLRSASRLNSLCDDEESVQLLQSVMHSAFPEGCIYT